MALDLATLQGNRLLASLDQNDLLTLQRHLQACHLEQDKILYDPKEQLERAYFPLTAALSAITIGRDGVMIEVGTVGNEGGVGIASYPGSRSVNRLLAQIPGQALMIEADVLSDAMNNSESLRRQMTAYQAAFLAQVSRSVACNGLHRIEQRCCRWLLMTRDRVPSDTFPLTHEYLSYMLGVRRAGVSEVLQTLKERRLLDYTRGSITILDRGGLEAIVCECYSIVCDYYRDLYGG